ncbi:hypothetical protein PR048_030548 [Dryococelus australis]|uniref:Uncharacterized protein n=1 Tax=Dryococelus australis TaxID=614101 RepID=A0ABQ9G9A0_9NEOP|nr:hypothetical protein PR048_030548 [Dryococelus australis]
MDSASAYRDRGPWLTVTPPAGDEDFRVEVFELEVLHLLQAARHATFPQDNTWPHEAMNVQAFFNERRVTLLPWPARSHDMSPMEQVWDMFVTVLQQPLLMLCGLAFKPRGGRFPRNISRKPNTISAYTGQKAKSEYRNRIQLERASQKQSSDTHKTPYDRVKRCRERKINTKASERVNYWWFSARKGAPCTSHRSYRFHPGLSGTGTNETDLTPVIAPTEIGIHNRATRRDAKRGNVTRRVEHQPIRALTPSVEDFSRTTNIDFDARRQRRGIKRITFPYFIINKLAKSRDEKNNDYRWQHGVCRRWPAGTGRRWRRAPHSDALLRKPPCRERPMAACTRADIDRRPSWNAFAAPQRTLSARVHPAHIVENAAPARTLSARVHPAHIVENAAPQRTLSARVHPAHIVENAAPQRTLSARVHPAHIVENAAPQRTLSARVHPAHIVENAAPQRTLSARVHPAHIVENAAPAQLTRGLGGGDRQFRRSQVMREL